jgi:hypothetical protein
MERQQMKTQTVYRTLMTLSFVGLLTACGGGGGGGGSDEAPAAAPSSGSGTVSAGGSDSDTVTGGVTKGPVSGATVLFYPVDQFGFPLAAEIATATTNASGNFSVTLPAGAGTVLVESFGGSYVDESDQGGNRVIQLGANDGFSSILPSGSSSVAINPITDSLVIRSRDLAAPEGGFGGIFNTSRASFASEAGFDAFTTVPANPTSPAAGASQAEKQYALLLGGLANAINNITVELGLGAPTYEVIRAVTFDLVDGELDGLKYGDPVPVQGANGVVNLTSDIDFDEEVNRFRNNNAAAYDGTPAPIFDFSVFANRVPTANAGADQTVARGAAVTLNGGASNDPEGGLFYNWVQTSGPAVTLAGATTATPTFTAPAVLIGSDVIVFTLTVRDAANATATDAVTVNVTGALPSKFVVVDEGELGEGIGENIDGGAVVTLDPGGTGNLLIDTGTVAVLYTVTGNTIRLTFPNGFISDDFDEYVGDDPITGDPIFVEIQEVPDFIEFTLAQDLANGDVINGHEEGQQISSDPSLIPNGTYAFDFVLKAYDFAQQIPFVIEDQSERMLNVNAEQQIPSLPFDDDLYEDILLFNANGTGSTDYTALTFTWAIQADGHLRVTYQTGDVADYYHMATSSTGDIVSTDMTLVTPLAPDDDNFINYVSLSFKRTPASPILTAANVPGVYTGAFSNDEDFLPYPLLSLRLNPDGTGSVELQLPVDETSDELYTITSSFGLCWNVDEDNVLITRRGFSRDLYFPGSRETDTTFCNGLEASGYTAFVRDLELFEIVGEQYRFHDRRLVSSNVCLDGIVDPDCVPGVLETESLNPRINTKEILTAVPPIAAITTEVLSIGGTVTVDVAAAAFARELPIDSTSVEIVNVPNSGTTTVNPATGEITFVADANSGFVIIEYRISDTAGNRSTIGSLFVEVDLPIAVATASQVSPNQLATLDASSSSDAGGIVAYDWVQFLGNPVVLDDPTAVSPSFVANDATLTSVEQLGFRLTVTDDLGLQDTADIFVDSGPVLPTTFFTLEEFAPPFQFGVDTGSGSRIALFSDNTGQILYGDGAQTFSWTDTNNTLTLDFTSFGGLVFAESVAFLDVDGDQIQEEIRRSTVFDSYEYTLVADSFGFDTFTRREIGNQNEENFTDFPGVIVPTAIDKTRNQTVVDFDFQTPFNITTEGETRSLLVSLADEFIDLNTDINLDELTFNLDGTGLARFKAETFTWMVDSFDGHLVVNFDLSLDVVNYYHLFTKDSGDVVAAIVNDNSAGSALSFKDDPAVDWLSRSSVPGLAGIYETTGLRIELTNGSVIAETIYYRLNADGTGVLEIPVYDRTTGAIVDWFTSSNGICWSEASNSLVWIRTTALDRRFTGDKMPESSADCLSFDFVTEDTLSNNNVNFRRDQTLFDINVNGQLRTTARSLTNFDPGVDTALATFSFFSRLFTFTPFIGDAIIAVPDAVTISEATLISIDVVTNDFQLSTAATVEILVGPKVGTAVVNGLNIDYTSDVGAELSPGFDTILYRVIDVSGNESTVGRVDITISPG